VQTSVSVTKNYVARRATEIAGKRRSANVEAAKEADRGDSSKAKPSAEPPKNNPHMKKREIVENSSN